MEHISKRFGSFYANKDISLTVNRGEVLTLLGENGAGKSTLMNILIGLYQPTEGKIFLEGREVRIESPSQAVKLGIGMVHQHFMLVEAMTVFDNIILGDKHAKGVFIDRAARRREIEELSAKYGLDVQLDKLITEISVGAQQRVEILKALYHGAELLILDEPSAALTDIEVEGLFAIMKKLVSEGKSIIFISHKMREVLHISDRITILRTGEVVTTVDAHGVTGQELANMMIGRELQQSQYEKKDVEAGAVISLQNIDYHKESKHAGLNDVSLSIGRGEIVGIAGVAGSGQQQLVSALFGLSTPEEGSVIEFCGKDITRATPREHRIMGIGYIPQDRLGAGGNGVGTLWENAIMGYHIAHGFKSRYFLDRPAIEKFTNDVIAMFHVKAQSIQDKLRSLSGGNMQKLIVGRESIQNNKLLLIEDPTRGIDVGAIEFVWAKLLDIAKSGVAILLVSHELNEVMQLSDRIKVIYNGELFDGGKYKEKTDKEIGLLMLGEHGNDSK